MIEAVQLPVVVLISGNGSNLQAMIDGQADGLPIRICGVISNRADAHGLERARAAGIPTEVLSHRDFPDRESYDAALRERIDRYDPALVILAGFMRILTPGLVARYQGRMFNIHPSLLPKYRGLHTHQRALDAGDTEHGASVHFVTDELDGGPVVLQAKVAVHPGDDAASLGQRVLEQEHHIYPTVVRWYAEGRLRLGEDGHPRLDGEILKGPLVINRL